MNDILPLFHHIHHKGNRHAVHHCGGDHRKNDPRVDYVIRHCQHGKHRIDKAKAIGHATGSGGELVTIEIGFAESCAEGGWHVESGQLI